MAISQQLGRTLLIFRQNDRRFSITKRTMRRMRFESLMSAGQNVNDHCTKPGTHAKSEGCAPRMESW